jgi:hypothetical protein
MRRSCDQLTKSRSGEQSNSSTPSRSTILLEPSPARDTDEAGAAYFSEVDRSFETTPVKPEPREAERPGRQKKPPAQKAETKPKAEPTKVDNAAKARSTTTAELKSATRRLEARAKELGAEAQKLRAAARKLRLDFAKRAEQQKATANKAEGETARKGK